MPQGSWLKAHGPEKFGAGARAWGPSADFLLAISDEPQALKHEPWYSTDRYQLLVRVFWVCKDFQVSGGL